MTPINRHRLTLIGQDLFIRAALTWARHRSVIPFAIKAASSTSTGTAKALNTAFTLHDLSGCRVISVSLDWPAFTIPLINQVIRGAFGTVFSRVSVRASEAEFVTLLCAGLRGQVILPSAWLAQVTICLDLAFILVFDLLGVFWVTLALELGCIVIDGKVAT